MKKWGWGAALVVLALGSCGGDDDSSSGSDGGTVADGGSTVDAASSACQPTGGLPMQADGKASIVATLSGASGGYNGTSAPFTSVYGAASTGDWLADTELPSANDATTRRIQFTFSPAPATPCQSFPITATPAVTALFITEGGPITGNFKKWLCEGTVIVDTVSGKANTFHFDGLVCKAFAFINNNAVGSVVVTGKGSATDIR